MWNISSVFSLFDLNYRHDIQMFFFFFELHLCILVRQSWRCCLDPLTQEWIVLLCRRRAPAKGKWTFRQVLQDRNKVACGTFKSSLSPDWVSWTLQPERKCVPRCAWHPSALYPTLDSHPEFPHIYAHRTPDRRLCLWPETVWLQQIIFLWPCSHRVLTSVLRYWSKVYIVKYSLFIPDIKMLYMQINMYICVRRPTYFYHLTM